MKTVTRVLVVVFISFCLLLKAHAQGEAGLSGIVTDPKGQPLQGAEIRIQGSDANKIGKVHTTANGHYSYPALEAGTNESWRKPNPEFRAPEQFCREALRRRETLCLGAIANRHSSWRLDGSRERWQADAIRNGRAPEQPGQRPGQRNPEQKSGRPAALIDATT